jgi:hypothetical protein
MNLSSQALENIADQVLRSALFIKTRFGKEASGSSPSPWERGRLARIEE